MGGRGAGSAWGKVEGGANVRKNFMSSEAKAQIEKYKSQKTAGNTRDEMRKNNDLDRSIKEVRNAEERYNRISRTHTKEQIQGFSKDMEKAIAKEKKKIEKPVKQEESDGSGETVETSIE